MKQTTYTLKNILKLTLELGRPRFGLSPDALFGIAARQNERRPFLFVSKVLGKHLPIRPGAMLAAGKLLAQAWMEEPADPFWTNLVNGATDPGFQPVWERLDQSRRTLAAGQRTLFIGFAETATGLAQSVADCFDGEMAYIATTRLELPGVQPFVFDEAHSHARTHLLYLEPDDTFVKSCKQIVLIDDEFTTGNTVLQLIEKLHEAYGVQEFVLMALLDNSSSENRRALEQRLGIRIKMVSLLQSSIVGVETGALPKPDLSNRCGMAGEAPEFMRLEPLPGAGRRMLTAQGLQRLRESCQKAAGRLAGLAGEKTLWLGSGEFIYAPALVAGLCGGRFFHSTTQSPVYPITGSAIVSGVHFDPLDSYSPTGYLYNVPKNTYHNVVLLVQEDTFQEKGALQLTGYLKGQGAEKVTVALL